MRWEKTLQRAQPYIFEIGKEGALDFIFNYSVVSFLLVEYRHTVEKWVDI